MIRIESRYWMGCTEKALTAGCERRTAPRKVATMKCPRSISPRLLTLLFLKETRSIDCAWASLAQTPPAPQNSRDEHRLFSRHRKFVILDASKRLASTKKRIYQIAVENEDCECSLPAGAIPITRLSRLVAYRYASHTTDHGVLCFRLLVLLLQLAYQVIQIRVLLKLLLVMEFSNDNDNE
jgi:hypothetical protein